MNWIPTSTDLLLPQEVIKALGWTVLHSLWQGAAIGLLLFVVLLAMRKKAAQGRYSVALGAMGLMLAIAIATFGYELDKEVKTTEALAVLAAEAEKSEVKRLMLEKALDEYNANRTNESLNWTAFLTNFLKEAKQILDKNAPLIVFLWFVGAIFFSIRLLMGLAFLKKLRYTGRHEVGEEWHYLLRDYETELGIRQVVQLAESALVAVPMVLGHLKPLILLPIGTINGMNPKQVEAILAHELTHIANADFFWNILQSIVEVIFYYHPVIWWVSGVVRTEREHRCDDIAVRLCGSSITYAKALVSVRELQSVSNFSMAMAFNGNGKKKPMLHRIQRILQPTFSHAQSANIMEKFTATGLLVAIGIAVSIAATKPEHRFGTLLKKDGLTITADTTIRPITRQRYSEAVINQDDGKQKVEFRYNPETQKITKLKIDDKTISESDYNQYKELTDRLVSEIPPPPPPAPNDMPPSIDGIAAPIPPAPPAPPSFRRNGRLSIKIDTSNDDNVSIRLYGNGEDKPMEIRVEDESVFMNGKKIIDEDEINIDFENLGDIRKWEHFGEEMARWGEEFGRKMEERFNSPEFQDRFERAFEYSFSDDEDDENDHAKGDRLSRKEQKRIQKEAQKEAKKDAKIIQKERQIVQRDAQREADRAMREADRAMREADRERKYAENAESVNKILETELLKDGLIQSAKEYQFSLSNGKMMVNGKKQPTNTLEKYRKLYEKSTGNANNNFNLNISKSDD